MSKLLIKEREVVVPGETIAEGMDFLPGFGTYRNKDKIISSRVGLLYVDKRALKVIPLSGRYIPKRNDTIIGKIIDVTLSGWRVDINSAYTGMIMLKDGTSEFINRGEDLTQYYNLGDYVVTKIINVTSQKLVDLSMKGPGLRKLSGGRIIKVNSFKVPRIIGKQGSMISMIKQQTGCRIIVGQNGLVWLYGEPEKEVLAIKAIRKIERESHISGLTDSIKGFFDEYNNQRNDQQKADDTDGNANNSEGNVKEGDQ